MDTLTAPYPPMPAGAGKAVIAPSASFKKQVYKSVAAIGLFVLVYILLLACCLALAIGGAFVGFAVMSTGVSIAFIFGAGIAAAGVLLLFFVVKFLFRHTKSNYSDMIEINKEDQPALIEFIDKLTAEIGSPKPKRIFFSANVNASVFYDSSFWSMFLPVKKNLQIGLGLVNSVNLSEFKAIMAHEFGHFSQRSMKFGSYVYNVNKIIYNMLFENESYHKIINAWARIHAIFRLMAMLNIYLIKGIQGILRKVYVMLNKTYLGLSREMEYHADAIAAYSAGSNQAVSSLNRIGIGQVCYDNLLNYLTDKLKENKVAGNFYEEHAALIRFYSQKNNFKTDDAGLPLIDDASPRVVGDVIQMDDPWSSHPLTDDRENHLKNLHIETETISIPAWSIFAGREQLQEQLTKKLYASVKVSPDALMISPEEFELDFNTVINGHRYNAVFKDYFDNRDITPFDVDEAVSAAGDAKALKFDDLFSDENCGLPELIARQEQNKRALEQLIETRKDIKHFYYKAAKLSRDEAAALQLAMGKEIAAAKERIKDLDKSTFVFFYTIDKRPETREQLINKYRIFFKCQDEALKDHDRCNDLIAAMSPVYRQMQTREIRGAMSTIYAYERTTKPRIKEIIEDNDWKDYISEDNLKAINNYLKYNWQYYMDPGYDNNAIGVFNKAMQAYAAMISGRVFSVKKDLLDFQAGLLAESRR